MVFAGVFPFSSYGGIDREERKHRNVLFLFKAQQIEKSESGPSFWRVQIWNDRSQKPKKNYGRHPMRISLLSRTPPPGAHLQDFWREKNLNVYYSGKFRTQLCTHTKAR
jgi:hypothetical protein